MALKGESFNKQDHLEVPLTIEETVAITLKCFGADDCRVGFENNRLNAEGISWSNNAASVAALYKEL